MYSDGEFCTKGSFKITSTTRIVIDIVLSDSLYLLYSVMKMFHALTRALCKTTSAPPHHHLDHILILNYSDEINFTTRPGIIAIV